MVARLSTWIALIVCLAAPAALAQGAAIGQVKTVSGAANILRDGNSVAAKPGDAVFEKDVIETGADGGIGITLVDNTVLSTGPNSQVALEEYKFDSNNFTGAMQADMRKGSMTMVSGDIARGSPGAMKVKTPTAILGVRGTRFAIQVGGS